MPGPLRFAPSSRNQAALDGIFFCSDYFSSTRIQKVDMGPSRGAYFSGTTACVGRTGGGGLLVIQGPISQAHHLSAPPKSHSKASKQQRVRPSLAQPATTPYLLGTNDLRCTSVVGHGSNALYCCIYTSYRTCPTLPGAQATKFESRIVIFPCLQQVLALT